MTAGKLRLKPVLVRLLVLLITLSALTALTQTHRTAAAPSLAPTDPGPIPVGGLARIGRGEMYEMLQSPNEKRLVIGSYLGVYMYDLATMRQIWFKQIDDLYSFSFSADSKQLLSIQGNTVIAWNVESGAQVRKYTSKSIYGIYEAAYSKDGKYIITTDGYEITTFDAKNGKILYTVSDPEIYDEWTVIDTSPDGSMFAISGWYGEYVSLWDTATGTMIHRFATEIPWEEFASTAILRFSPDSQYLIAGMDNGMIITWNAKTGAFLHRQQLPEWGIAEINFSADSTQFVVGSGSIYVYDTLSGSLLRSYPSLPYSTYGPYFSTSGQIHAINFAADGFKLWNADTNSVIIASSAHAPGFVSAALTNDGKTLFLGRFTGVLEKWNAQTRERLSSAPTTGSPRIIAMAPNGTQMAMFQSGTDKRVLISDIATGAPVITLDLSVDSQISNISRLTYTPDGTLWVSSRYGIITQWDVATGQMLRKFAHYTDTAYDVTISPNGQRIAFWLENGIIMWDVATDTQIVAVPYFTDDFGVPRVYASAFTKDGLKVVAADTAFIKVFDTTTAKELFSFNIEELANPSTMAMAISSDSRVLAVGHTDGMVSLWNIKTGRKIRTMDGHGGRIVWLGFSPINGQLISASDDGTAVYWPRP